MKLSICMLIFSTLLSFLFHRSVGAYDETKDMQRKLYTVIHDMALPRIHENTLVTERFILLEPGEVLNYYDYCPSEKLKPNEKGVIPSASLPPDENTFMLTDKLPNLNPLRGALTGKRLSTIYRDILYTIDTSAPGPNPLSTSEYHEAMEFLQESVADPKAPNDKQPHFELYHRYEREYYDTVATVKHWLNKNKTEIERKNGNYETWYHENYEALTSHISAAYSQWLVNGQKSQVEEKIAVVDVKSARSEIEEARRILQQEQMPSMDGGSLYYPVHLEPGNWYEYLLASESKPTRGQIQAKIRDLKMRLLQLESMMNSPAPSDEDLKKLSPSKDQEVMKKIKDAAAAIRCYEYLCEAKKSETKLADGDMCKKKYKASNPCDEVTNQRKAMDAATQSLTEIQTKSDLTKDILGAYKSTDASLQGIIKQLKAQIANLEEDLKSAPIESPVINKAKGKGNMAQKEIEQNWMSFSFDSETTSKSFSSDSKTYKDASSFSASGLFWSAKGGASYSHSEKDFQQAMSKAHVSVTAKLLRVTINRNWFRPSIFQISNFLRMQTGVTSVSPGPKADEGDFVREASNYQLPEYTTGFLLAKEVSMTFRGVDSSTCSHALKKSASGDLSGSYGPFKASASFSYGHESSNLQVSIQSDGLHIDIPGAQIIGYYTSVLPKFPINEQRE